MKLIIIHENLLLPPVVTINGDTLFCSPAFSYQWFLDSVPIPNAVGNYYVMTVPGSYSVRITDSLGCIESSELFTTLIAEALINGTVSASPNPSNGLFNLYFNLVKNYQVVIDVFNAVGVNVFSMKVPLTGGHNMVPVDIGNVSDGMYILKIQAGHLIHREKLVINR